MHTVEQDEPRRGSRLRFSLLALFLFVTLVCVLLAWWARPRRYIVEAMFRLDAIQALLLGDSSSTFDPQEFALLRKTHGDLIRSDEVLLAALRDPQIAALPLLKSQQDPVRWLRNRIEVDTPDTSELLVIRLRCAEGVVEDCRQIVDSVADAYLQKVVFEEERQRLAKRDALTLRANAMEDQLRQRLAKVQELAKDSGPSDPEVIIQQIQVDAVSKVWQEALCKLETSAVDSAAASRVRRVQKAISRPE